MKRFSPIVVAMALAAVLVAVLRRGTKTAPDEAWRPVEPS